MVLGTCREYYCALINSDLSALADNTDMWNFTLASGHNNYVSVSQIVQLSKFLIYFICLCPLNFDVFKSVILRLKNKSITIKDIVVA